MSLLPPQLDRNYRDLWQLGHGGSGVVTCAQKMGPMGFRQLVAIKRLQTDDPAQVEALQREARLGGLLRHQNLVTVYELEQTGETWQLVMELVDGFTFRALIVAARQGRITLPSAVAFELVAQAATGLHYAHRARGADGRPLHLVHADIKPENLMLSRDGLTKVLDLGLAQVHVEGRVVRRPRALTRTYAAPEQLEGTTIGPGVDTYALGRVLLELLTRQSPSGSTAQSVDGEVPAHWREALRGEPRAALPLLSRVLERDVSRRLCDAGEMAAALRALGGSPLRVSAFATEIASRMGGAADRCDSDAFLTAATNTGNVRWIVAVAGLSAQDPRLAQAGDLGAELLDIPPPRHIATFDHERDALQWLADLLAPPACAVAAGMGPVSTDPALTSGWGGVSALTLKLVKELPLGAALVFEPESWREQRNVGPMLPRALRCERLGRFRFPGSGEARPLLEVRLATAPDQPAPMVPGIYTGGGIPFRGLSSYTTADAAQFYGRGDEVQALRQALGQASLLTLTSASGGGKTSLIQAGLIPAMSECLCHVIRPGPDPLLRLRTELGDANPDPQFQAEQWARDLLHRAKQQGKQLLLVVDQAEELVTLCVDRNARLAVTQALVALADAGAKVLLSVRADFFASLAITGALRGRAADKVIVLGPPGREACREAFLRPLEEFGYQVDDGILEVLLDALPGEAAALVLLQVCGERLWMGRDRQHRRLTVERFQQMGGLRGAIGEHADAIMADLSPLERRATRRLLNAMITDAGTRQPLTFIAASRLVGAEAGGGALVDRLVRQRLLVASDGVRGETMVDIVHDTLISDWSVLHRDREQAAETMHHLEALHHAATAWEDRGRPTDLLWDKALFSWLKQVEDREGLPLSLMERTFIQASRMQARWKRIRTSLVLVLTFLLLSTTGYWFYEQRRSSQQAARLEAERVTTLEQLQTATLQQTLERSSRAQARGNDLLAIQLAMSALEQAPDSRDALRTLLSAVGPRQELAILAGHTKGIGAIEFSPDGRFILTSASDGTVRLWDRSGRAIAVLCQQEAGTPSATFSPGSDAIATVTDEGLFQLWNVDGSLRTQTTLEGPTHTVVWNRSHADRIAVADRNGVIRLLTAEGRVLKRWQAQDPVKILEFKRVWIQWSPDGDLLASEGSDGFLHFWTIDGEPAGAAFEIDGIAGGQFSADGQMLMATTFRNGLWLWHRASHTVERFACATQYHTKGSFRPGGGMARCGPEDDSQVVMTDSDGRFLHTLTEHRKTVNEMQWSPDGQRLATRSINGELFLWNADGKMIFRARGHRQPISSMAWSPDGKILATAVQDGTVRLWDGQGQPRRQLQLPETLRSLHWSPSGQRLIAATDGDASTATAVIAEVREGITMTPLELERPIMSAAWDPSERGVATLDDQGVIALWSVSGALLRRLEAPPIYGIAYHPYQRVLAAIGVGGGLFLYDQNGSLLASDPNAHAYSVDWSPSGDQLALGVKGADMTIRSWPDLSILSRLDTGASRVHRVCWSPEGDRLATTDESSRVAIWTPTGEEISSTIIPSSARIEDCDWSSDGAYLATAGSDSRARIWTRSGELTTVYAGGGPAIVWVTWHPTLPQLLLFCVNNPVEVIDVEGHLLATLDSGPGTYAQMDWSPDGNAVATGSERETYVQIWPWGKTQLLEEVNRLLPGR